MVLTLAHAVRARGYRPLVILPATGCGWLAGRCADRGIATATLRHRHAADPACLLDLVRLIQGHDLDLVHSHEFTPSVFGAAAAALTGRPHLLTIHGEGAWMRRRRNGLALRWAASRSASRVAVSAATARWLSNLLGLPIERFEEIPNGVEVQPAEWDPGRRALDVPPETTLLLAVGNLSPVKGHRVLLEVPGPVATAGPELRWATVHRR